MDFQAKNDIRKKARLAYGLIHVLKYDIDIFRSDLYDFDLESMHKSIEDINRSLSNIASIMSEIDYILYLNDLEEPF